jgi:hypothetical protein
MQGGSHWSGRAVEPERARWHDPVLGRWLGLTPEQPPTSTLPEGLPKVAQGGPAVGLVTLPRPGLGRLFREPRGRLGGRYAKNVDNLPDLDARARRAPHQKNEAR